MIRRLLYLILSISVGTLFAREDPLTVTIANNYGPTSRSECDRVAGDVGRRLVREEKIENVIDATCQATEDHYFKIKLSYWAKDKLEFTESDIAGHRRERSYPSDTDCRANLSTEIGLFTRVNGYTPYLAYCRNADAILLATASANIPRLSSTSLLSSADFSPAQIVGTVRNELEKIPNTKVVLVRIAYRTYPLNPLLFTRAYESFIDSFFLDSPSLEDCRAVSSQFRTAFENKIPLLLTHCGRRTGEIAYTFQAVFTGWQWWERYHARTYPKLFGDYKACVSQGQKIAEEYARYAKRNVAAVFCRRIERQPLFTAKAVVVLEGQEPGSSNDSYYGD